MILSCVQKLLFRDQAHRVQFPSSTRNGRGGRLPVFRETIVAGCLFLAAVQGRAGSKKVIHLFPLYPKSVLKLKLFVTRSCRERESSTFNRLVTRTRTFTIDNKVACKCPLFAGVGLYFK